MYLAPMAVLDTQAVNLLAALAEVAAELVVVLAVVDITVVVLAMPECLIRVPVVVVILLT